MLIHSSRLSDKLKVLTAVTEQVASLSNCSRAKVGCVIVTSDFAHIWFGYNGPPYGTPNTSCSEKTVAPGACGCVHAEANALQKCRTVDDDCVLMTSLSPCIHCAGLILNSKVIRQVLFIKPYRDLEGLKLLRSSNIIIRQTEENYDPFIQRMQDSRDY